MTAAMRIEAWPEAGLSAATAGSRKRSAPHRLRVWIAVAACVLVVGVTGSVFGALALAQGSAVQSQHDFDATSAQTASALTVSLQHENDLITSAVNLVGADPSADRTAFSEWATSVDAFARYPELVGIDHVVLVRAADLAASAADATPHRSGPPGPNGTFAVQPAGTRGDDCFATAQLARDPADALPAGHDFCAGARGTLALAARDTGQSSYAVTGRGSRQLLWILSPVYGGGGTPVTAAQRREAFLGWVDMALDPHVILSRALQGQPADVGVAVEYHAHGSNVAFHDGAVRRATVSTTQPLRYGWTIKTFGAVTPASITADSSVLLLLLSGIAVTLLVVTLLLVLATTRSRALRLVDIKTEELSHQATHDALTGLPNRLLIMDRTEQLLARARRKGSPVAALFIDLDDFKTINDTLGHEVGDRVLRAVGRRIRTALRDADTVGRLGGDEFVVLIDGDGEEATPVLVAERIFQILRQPLDLGGLPSPVVVTASIGIAVGLRPDASDLLRDADLALYAAKAAGKNRAELYRPELKSAAELRYQLERDLRGALGRGEFHLVYQPLHNLGTLTMKGTEALLRWRHPTLGEVPPATFVPILEDTGGIVEVGRWVLREACRQVAAWRDRGHRIGVSVNLSARQLEGESIVTDIHNALAQHDLDPRVLTLEITETALMRNIEVSTTRLWALKALGVYMAIDDFGTGYSSLSYLQRFPVDCLKIDRCFIAAVDRSMEAAALVHTVVKLAQDLGLVTLAEGVETPGQMERLRLEHVDYAQGFLFERPLEPTAIDALLGSTEAATRGDRTGPPLTGASATPAGPA